MEIEPLGISEFVESVNYDLVENYRDQYLVGEVASYKTSHDRWIFFDLKDADSSVSCFMPIWQLRTPIEDGMKIIVKATPKITAWGKFSLTVGAYKPVGEGNIKKAFDILKAKLEKEGLFAAEKKRPLLRPLNSIGVISSPEAAGYADFIKILNARWGGLDVKVAKTQVQGLDAPDQIIRALNYFNEKSDVDLIVIIRGGGSKDDLSAFNDEKLVRTIAASRIPTITGIGHEVDTSLSDLAADLVGSTPSNVAELIVPDRKTEAEKLRRKILDLKNYLLSSVKSTENTSFSRISGLKSLIFQKIAEEERKTTENLQKITREIVVKITTLLDKNESKIKILEALNPEKALRQGYAILSGKISPGSVVKITTNKNFIQAKIISLTERKS